jgi:cyanate lyase
MSSAPDEECPGTSRLFRDGQELKVGGADEHAIVRDERHTELDRRGGDPPVAVMDLVSQSRRVAPPDGDRVEVVLNDKFLPYQWT